MSQTPIRCPRCKTPLATRHHAGHIKPLNNPEIAVVIVSGETRIKCPCGGMLAIQQPFRRKVAA